MPAHVTDRQTCSSTRFPRAAFFPQWPAYVFMFLLFASCWGFFFVPKTPHLLDLICLLRPNQFNPTSSRPNEVYHAGLFLGLLSKSTLTVMDDVPRTQEANGCVGALRCFETASAPKGRRRGRRRRKMALCVVLMTLLATVHLVWIMISHVISFEDEATCCWAFETFPFVWEEDIWVS